MRTPSGIGDELLPEEAWFGTVVHQEAGGDSDKNRAESEFKFVISSSPIAPRQLSRGAIQPNSGVSWTAMGAPCRWGRSRGVPGLRG